MKIHSLESCRADVSRNDINNHFDKLSAIFTTVHTPSLTMNIDESREFLDSICESLVL